jgi:hypothetical protein
MGSFPPWKISLPNGQSPTISCDAYAQLLKTLCLVELWPQLGVVSLDLHRRAMRDAESHVWAFTPGLGPWKSHHLGMITKDISDEAVAQFPTPCNFFDGVELGGQFMLL